MVPWVKYLLYKRENFVLDPRTHVRARPRSAGTRMERCPPRRDTGLLASQSSIEGKLQVQWQDLSQKIRSEVTEEDIQCWLLASKQTHTRECVCTRGHILYIHIQQRRSPYVTFCFYSSINNSKGRDELVCISKTDLLENIIYWDIYNKLIHINDPILLLG